MEDIVPRLRRCTRCGEEKPCTSEFFHPDKGYKYGLNSRCRGCLKEYRRNWQKKYRATEEGRLAHRLATKKWEASEVGSAKNASARLAWKAKNREAIARRQRELRAAESPEKRGKRIRDGVEYKKRRGRADPVFRMRHTVSSRIATALRTRGNSKRGRNWESLVGYSLAELRAHIERQFSGRMSWANYGEWHIDHIIPVAAFEWRSADDPGFKACWALSNLRPLWADANRRKKSKRLFLI